MAALPAAGHGLCQHLPRRHRYRPAGDAHHPFPAARRRMLRPKLATLSRLAARSPSAWAAAASLYERTRHSLARKGADDRFDVDQHRRIVLAGSMALGTRGNGHHCSFSDRLYRPAENPPLTPHSLGPGHLRCLQMCRKTSVGAPPVLRPLFRISVFLNKNSIKSDS